MSAARAQQATIKQAAVKMVHEGFTLATAAAEAGVSRQAVHLWVKASGGASLEYAFEKNKATAKVLIRDGKLNFTEIVEATGLSRLTVGKIMLSTGLDY